jgi:phage tail-like protein
MAEKRERPYGQFNFLVKIGDQDGKKFPDAAFQEVGGLGTEITVAEYRSGNYPINSPMKITGTFKVPDVTLKRGVFGELALLHAWMKDVRDKGQGFRKTVVIQLQREDHTGPVQSWTLREARPIKYTGPALSAKGTDVAIEELVLSCENIDIE